MKRYLLFLFILIISIFIFTGCSKGITGKYKIIEMKDENGVVINKNKLKKLNINYSIIINKDNTAIINIEEKEKVKYNDKYFYSMKDKSDKIYYTFNGKRLILEVSDLELVFEKG